MTFCIPKLSMIHYCKDPWIVKNTYSLRGNVRQISTNTWGVDNIVEGEFINERAELQKQGQRLKRGKKVSVQAINLLIISVVD